ncbi:MAG: TolC family protein [Alphaproteobacteria bacterium]|nr:TolC family protein [Alphaproteobacteria bacterium]
MKNFNITKTLSAITLGTILSACALESEPYTAEQRFQRVGHDLSSLFDNQEEIIKPITLYEAMARAIKYNINQRVETLDNAITLGIAENATIDMLPSIVANGGYTVSSKSQTYKAKMHGEDHKYKENNEHKNIDLQMAFNIIDFGVSYVNAKQASDRVLIAGEMRRKSIQQLVHDVRASFWKVAAGQRIGQDAKDLTTAIQNELTILNSVDPSQKTVDQLNQEQALLESLKKIAKVQKEITLEREKLAKLLNIHPNTPFELDIPMSIDSPSIIRDLGMLNLEEMALVNRPELRIKDYEARLFVREAKKELLRLFPGIELTAGLRYDSSNYLQNKNWTQAGVGVSWNLMRLFTTPGAIEQANRNTDLKVLQRQALTMAIISQVNIAYMQLKQTADIFDVDNAMQNVSDNLWQKTFDNTKATKPARNKAINSAVELMLTHYNRDLSFAEYKTAQSNLFASLGFDIVRDVPKNITIGELSEQLEASFTKLKTANGTQMQQSESLIFQDETYAYPPSEFAKLTVLSNEDRTKILEWTNLRKEEPQIIAPVPAAYAKQAPIKKAKKRTSKPTTENLALLQISSFESLDSAKSYWSELTSNYDYLNSYAPVFRQVNVKNQNRYRTFISDTETKLKNICQKIYNELKSCIISKQ